jgi:hypothetical protein
MEELQNLKVVMRVEADALATLMWVRMKAHAYIVAANKNQDHRQRPFHLVLSRFSNGAGIPT